MGWRNWCALTWFALHRGLPASLAFPPLAYARITLGRSLLAVRKKGTTRWLGDMAAVARA